MGLERMGNGKAERLLCALPPWSAEGGHLVAVDSKGEPIVLATFGENVVECQLAARSWDLALAVNSTIRAFENGEFDESSHYGILLMARLREAFAALPREVRDRAVKS